MTTFAQLAFLAAVFSLAMWLLRDDDRRPAPEERRRTRRAGDE